MIKTIDISKLDIELSFSIILHILNNVINCLYNKNFKKFSTY